MNSEQFARLCYAVEPFQTDYVEVQTEDLRALIDDKVAAYEKTKHLEGVVNKALDLDYQRRQRIAELENLLRQALCGPLK